MKYRVVILLSFVALLTSGLAGQERNTKYAFTSDVIAEEPEYLPENFTQSARFKTPPCRTFDSPYVYVDKMRNRFITMFGGYFCQPVVGVMSVNGEGELFLKNYTIKKLTPKEDNKLSKSRLEEGRIYIDESGQKIYTAYLRRDRGQREVTGFRIHNLKVGDGIIQDVLLSKKEVVDLMRGLHPISYYRRDADISRKDSKKHWYLLEGKGGLLVERTSKDIRNMPSEFDFIFYKKVDLPATLTGSSASIPQLLPFLRSESDLEVKTALRKIAEKRLSLTESLKLLEENPSFANIILPIALRGLSTSSRSEDIKKLMLLIPETPWASRIEQLLNRRRMEERYDQVKITSHKFTAPEDDGLWREWLKKRDAFQIKLEGDIAYFVVGKIKNEGTQAVSLTLSASAPLQYTGKSGFNTFKYIEENYVDDIEILDLAPGEERDFLHMIDIGRKVSLEATTYVLTFYKRYKLLNDVKFSMSYNEQKVLTKRQIIANAVRLKSYENGVGLSTKSKGFWEGMYRQYIPRPDYVPSSYGIDDYAPSKTEDIDVVGPCFTPDKNDRKESICGIDVELKRYRCSSGDKYAYLYYWTKAMEDKCELQPLSSFEKDGYYLLTVGDYDRFMGSSEIEAAAKACGCKERD